MNRISCKNDNIKIQPHKKKESTTTITTADELTQDEDFDINIQNNHTFGCPYKKLKIYDVPYEMLVDFGVEIGAISTTNEEQIIKENSTIPKHYH